MGHDKKLLNRCWKSTFILKLLKVQVKPHFGRFSQSNVFKNKSRGAGIMLVLQLAPLIHSRWIHAVRSLHVQLEPQQVFGSSSFFMLWSCCQATTKSLLNNKKFMHLMSFELLFSLQWTDHPRAWGR